MSTSADMLANYRDMLESMTGNPRAASVKFTQDMGWEFIAALLRALKDGEEALRATEPNNATSAATGRSQCGGPSREEGIARQSVIGEPRGGGQEGVDGGPSADISHRASGQSFVGTYQGVPVYADPEFPV